MRTTPQQRQAMRRYNLRRQYGLSEAEFYEMGEAQDWLCAICRKAETKRQGGNVQKLAVDHDHLTGVRRALLCSECNTGLGKFGDRSDRLCAAAGYLMRYGR